MTCLLAVGCGPSDPQGPICDPLAGPAGASGASAASGASGSSSGLKASLYSLPSNLARNVGVLQAESMGTKLGFDVYLSQLYVPTQRFDAGFTAANGVPLTNADGSIFTSWFALHIEGYLVLNTQQLPGQYQLALFSDDGSLVQVGALDSTGQVGNFQTIVNNDFSHESMLQVASQPITFTSVGQRLPIKVDYFQGSPDYLSLILLMRPWPSSDTEPVMDPLVGVDEPSNFWNWNTTPSTPGPLWTDLLSRGWQVVGTNNFTLDGVNPCK